MVAGRNIKGITIEIDGNTTKLNKALKDTENQIRDSANHLKDIDKLLKMDPGNTELLTQKYKNLQTEISGAKDKLKTLKEAQEQMARDGKVGTEEYDALQREIVETEQKIKSLTKEMRNFGSVSAQQVAAAGEKIKKVGGQIEGVGRSLMPVSTAVTAAGTVAVSKFAEVDKTMTLTNKTMGNTEAQAKLLDKAMQEAAMNSTFGMNDAAQASLNFARAGLSAEEAAAAMAPAMNLAAGEGGNLDTVSAGLVGTINGFGDTFNNASRYADVFAAACNNSALDVDSLSDAMGIAAPVFKTAGYTVNDAALYMGILADNNIEASEAANALKTGIARLIAPADQGAKMMDKLGISVTNADGSMKDTITIQKELHDAFAGLSESEQIAAASAIFGKNQMSKWLALINAAPEDVQKLSNEISNCAGTTDEMAKSMMSGFGGSLEKLKSSIDVAAYEFGKALAPTISKVADAIQRAVDWFNSLDDEQKTAIANAALVVAAAGPVLIVLGKLTTAIGTIMTWTPQIVGGIKTVGGAVSNLVPTLSGGLSSLWTFMSADLGGTLAAGGSAAIGTMAAAVGGSIVSFFGGAEFGKMLGTWMFPDDAELYTHYAGVTGTVEMMKDTVVTLGERTKEHLTEAWGTITEAGSTFAERTGEHYNNVQTKASESLENIKIAGQTFAERTGEHFNTFKENTNQSLDNVKEAAGTFAERTGEHFDSFKEKTNTVLENVAAAQQTFQERSNEHWQAVGDRIRQFTDDARSKFDTFKGNINSNIDNIKSKIDEWKQKFTDLKSGIDSSVEGMKTKIDSFKQKFDDVKSHIQGVVDYLKGCFNFDWKLPDLKLPHINISGSFSIDPPSAPHFSIDWYAKAMEKGMILNSPTIFGMAGGKFLGGGEAGPEAVVGTSSLQNMITGAVAAAGAGGDIVIPVYIGNERLETLVVKAQQVNNYRSGGR